MELKISKIQWKKVLAFALTLCMSISMVQLPVNAEETTGTVSTPQHFDVRDLQYYEETATFFDAAADRDAISVQTIEENKTYTVDPTTGYYDAKWFSFTPKETGIYAFKANKENGSAATLLEKTSDGEYRFIDSKDYYEEGNRGYDLFYIESALEKNKTYYLCAGYSYTSANNEAYSFSVTKNGTTELSSQPVKYKKGSGAVTYSFTAPKTGYYNLKYTWKNNGGEDSSWADIDFEWNYDNKQAVCIYGPDSKNQKLYYVFCEAGKTYYLRQNDFRVDDESADAEISIYEKEGVQKITSSTAGKATAGTVQNGTNSTLFEVKLDESGYYNLNLDWGEAESEKADIDGYGYVYNIEGSEISYNYLNSNSLEKFYVQKGKVYYVVINDLAFFDKEYNLKEYTASVTLVKDRDVEQEITTSKPGEFKTGYEVNRLFKFTPTNTAYYNIQFVPQKDIDMDSLSTNIYLRDSDGNEEPLYPEEYNNVYCKEGQDYYIDVKMCDVDEEDVLFKVQISQLPMENLDYSKGGKLAVSYRNNENKIFKFTAQYTGQHVLKYSWDNKDADLGVANPIIEENGATSKHYKDIKIEDANSYQSVYLKKGNTYYFDFALVTFKSRTTGEYTDVDVSIDIAYYNGKTDIDTIKNEKPMIPGEDNGNTDKPDNGNTDKPDNGNTDKPDNGSTDKPDNGNTDKPNNGNTTKPDNGNTNKPNNSTEKPDTNKTNKPATIKVSKIKISALSNKIAAGKKVKLTAAVAPANASNKAVKWTTSNKKVAVVSKNGVVTVNKKAGGKSVVITAIAADGKGARATYKITVMKDAVKKVTITGKNVVKAGKKLKLKAKVAAGKKANKKLVWSTSNKKFATVNQKGVVIAKKAGKGKKVKITAKATDGSNKKKVFTIKIK